MMSFEQPGPCTVSTLYVLPYFFGYKTEYFPSKNNFKNLDPSYKMDLDLWDGLERVELVF